MDFIKNIKKDFILSSEYDIIKNVFRLKLPNFNRLGIKVKVTDLDLESITFMLSDTKSLDNAVGLVVEGLITKLNRDAKKTTKLVEKVIKAWDDNPGDFNVKEDPGKYYPNGIYENRGLLDNEEYFQSIDVRFDKYRSYHDFSFITGNGGDTYYNKQYFVDKLDGMDAWVLSEIKKLRSGQIKKRIGKYLSKSVISLTHKEVLKFITIPEEPTTTKNPIRPPFPIVIDSDFLNDFLSETGGDSVEIDEEDIQIYQDEYGFDISKLVDWEISAKTGDYHNTDGQICRYTVVFSSPEGHEYHLYNSHSLMTGWSFSGELKPQ